MTNYRPKLDSYSASGRRKVSLIVFFLGLIIAIGSCSGYSINYVPPAYQLGLIQMLPPLFWVGFALCVGSLLDGVSRDGEMVFLIKSLLLCVLIWNITTLVLAYPYAPGSYMHVFEASPILLTGHLPAADEGLHWLFKEYPASFPGYSILLSSVFYVTDVDPLQFAKYYPLFSSVITFLAIWLFYGTLQLQKHYRFALVIVLLANTYFQLHVSPQSAGFFVGLLVLVALEQTGWRWRVAAAVLFAYVTISHPTTAFMVLSAAGLAWLFRLLVTGQKKVLLEPAPFFVVGWLAWARLFAAPFWAKVTGLGLAAGADPVPFGVNIHLGSIVPASIWPGLFEGSSWVPALRFSVLGVFAVCSMIYLIWQWLGRVEHSAMRQLTHTAFLIAPVVLAVVDALSLGARQQLHDRYLLFFMLVACVLVVGLIASTSHAVKRNVLFAVLTAVALLGFLTTFYHSARYTYSSQTFAASEFVDAHTRCGVIGGWVIPNVSEPDQSAILRQLSFYSLYPTPIADRLRPAVIVFDDHARASYELSYGLDRYDIYVREVAGVARFHLVYLGTRHSVYWYPGRAQ